VDAIGVPPSFGGSFDSATLRVATLRMTEWVATLPSVGHISRRRPRDVSAAGRRSVLSSKEG